MVLNACALVPSDPNAELARLPIGIDNNEIKQRIGKPTEVRGLEKREGAFHSTWLYKTTTITTEHAIANFIFGIPSLGFCWMLPCFGYHNDYLVYLENGKMVKWQNEEDSVDQDIRVRENSTWISWIFKL